MFKQEHTGFFLPDIFCDCELCDQDWDYDEDLYNEFSDLPSVEKIRPPEYGRMKVSNKKLPRKV